MNTQGRPIVEMLVVKDVIWRQAMYRSAPECTTNMGNIFVYNIGKWQASPLAPMYTMAKVNTSYVTSITGNHRLLLCAAYGFFGYGPYVNEDDLLSRDKVLDAWATGTLGVSHKRFLAISLVPIADITDVLMMFVTEWISERENEMSHLNEIDEEAEPERGFVYSFARDLYFPIVEFAKSRYAGPYRVDIVTAMEMLKETNTRMLKEHRPEAMELQFSDKGGGHYV